MTTQPIHRHTSARRGVAVTLGTLSLIWGLTVPAGAYPRPGATEQLTVARGGGQANNESGQAAISADGRFVAFTSMATNLIDGPPAGGGFPWEVFLRDRHTGTTERVSVAADGGPPNSGAGSPSVSADGRFVAFGSSATNLVPGGTSPGNHVFVRDRMKGLTERVSVASDGTPGNDWSWFPAISADGRFVAFNSGASNLVPGDTGEVDMQMFVHDRETGVTERVSVASDGTPANGRSFDAPSISADGRFVAFVSRATNLVPDDTNGTVDVFVHDRDAGTTERVSVASGGAEANNASHPGSISADGRFVAFKSEASNLVPNDTYHGNDDIVFDDIAYDVFVHDRQTEKTERVSVASDGSQANGGSDMPAISADGRFVAFMSAASNLVPDGRLGLHVFVHERFTGATEAVSVADDGTMEPGMFFAPAISGDGSVVAFESDAKYLVTHPVSDTFHVFSRDRGAPVGILGTPSVDIAPGSVRVSGQATFSGATISEASDPDGDGVPGARNLGAELTGATVTYRPELEDLLIRWDVPWMPPAMAVAPGVDVPGGGSPGVLFGWEVEVTNTYPARFEVRAHWASATSGTPGAPRAALYRCEPVDLDGIIWECTEVAELGVSYGSTGQDVRVSVPLEPLEADGGTRLGRMRAFTGLGEAATGEIATLDEVFLPTVVLPPTRVQLGIAPSGTPADEVAFDTEAGLIEGLFEGAVSSSGLAPRDYRVWARACLGDECRVASSPITID